MSEFVNNIPPSEELLRRKPVVIFTSNWGGLGHTMRDISIIKQLVNRGIPTLSCSQRGVEHVIRASFMDLDPDVFGTLDLQDTTKPREYDPGLFLHTNQRVRDPLRHAGVVLADFMPEVKKVHTKQTNGTTLVTGTYHSLDQQPSSDEIAHWQESMLGLAEPFDVLFHMTITKPPESYNQRIIAINPIARDVTRSPEDIKEELGLTPDEDFVLIAGGLGGHPVITSLLHEATPRSDNIRYVVQLGQESDPPEDFPPHLIWANGKLDGHNYINAARAVVAKPGYGTLAECLATDTPVLFAPHEHPEGKANIGLMGSLLEGLPVALDMAQDPDRQITNLLSASEEISARMSTIPCDGANVVADFLESARQAMLRTS